MTPTTTENGTVASDFPLAEFLEFARSKPADERFDYTDSSVCALTQFGRATGREHLTEHSGSALLFGELPALNDALAAKPETFGALVTRLEALVQEQPAKPSVWLDPLTYMEGGVGAMPSARAGRASHRAGSRLGHAATIAIAGGSS